MATALPCAYDPDGMPADKYSAEARPDDSAIARREVARGHRSRPVAVRQSLHPRRTADLRPCRLQPALPSARTRTGVLLRVERCPTPLVSPSRAGRSEEHTSELQSHVNI